MITLACPRWGFVTQNAPKFLTDLTLITCFDFVEALDPLSDVEISSSWLVGHLKSG